MSLDKAAQAFDTDMGNSNSSSQSSDRETSQTDISDVFPHMGAAEDDVRAGGDDLPDARPQRRQRAPNRDEEDEDVLAAREVEGDGEDFTDFQDFEEGDDPEEGQEGDDPEEGGEDEDEGEEDNSARYEVLVDGEPVEVSLNEALAGYIRTDTFHRRLNKLTEYEGQINTISEEVVAQRDRYIAMVEEMDQNLTALVPPEPDWDKIFAEMPIDKARKLQKDYEALGQKRTELQKAAEKAREENRLQQEQNFKKWKAGENRRLAQLFPSWNDPQKGVENMKRDVKAMAATAKAAGFDEKTIEETHDSRMILILHKAAAFDRIMSRKTPKPVEKRGKKPITHGAGRTRTAPKGNDRSMQRLSRTGKVEDAAAVFARIIK